MNLKKKSQAINRIISGYHRFNLYGRTFFLRSSPISLKVELDDLYDEIYEQNIFNGWLTKNQCYGILMRNKLIDIKHVESLKELETKIEDLKIALYTSLLKPDIFKRVRKDLEQVNRKYIEMSTHKDSLDYITAEGFAESYIRQYEIINCLYNEDGQPVEVDSFPFLNDILNEVLDSHLSTKELREISRTDPWRTLWMCGKPNPFGTNIVDWTDLQKTVVGLSRMYDSVFEHPDCPDSSVIEDDDVFDGWMLFQKRENEKHKAENKMDKLLRGKLKDKDEIYVRANNKEEASKIDDMNSIESKITKKTRQKLIDNNDVVLETQLPDVKEKYKRQAMQAMSEAAKRMKGK